MERITPKKRSRMRGGFFPFFLALILFLVTVIGAVSSLLPKNALSRALEKTGKEIASRDEVLLFLLDSLKDGSFQMEGENTQISYTATLPEGAALFAKGDAGETKLTARGEKLVLESEGISDQALWAERTGAADALSDSAFSDAGLPEGWMRLVRGVISLTDPEFDSVDEALSQAFKHIVKEADPSFETKKGEVESEGTTRKGKAYTYTLDREGLSRALAALSEEGGSEEFREKLGAIWSLISAFSGDRAQAEKKEAFVSFLSGTSPAFSQWKEEILTEGAAAQCSFFVSSGRVRNISFSLLGGEFSLEGEICFGAKAQKDGKESVSLSARRGEEELFSCSFSHEITEDSDSALIRRLSYSLSDPCGFILSEKEKDEGHVTFSWGRKKGDLGLRLLLGETEVNFRGAVGEYKKRKNLSFTLKRVEYDRRNLLKEESLLVTVSAKGETPQLPKAEGALFPSGEEREALAASLAARFQALFPEEYQ